MRQRLAQRCADVRRRSIAVLAGGSSAEREVSLVSGRAVAASLQAAGLTAELLLVNRDNVSFSRDPQLPSTELVGQLEGGGSPQPSDASRALSAVSEAALLPELRRAGIIFTTLHGTCGEDGVWQGLLELLDVPYVSAGVKGSALAMDKLTTKRLCQVLGVPTPEYWVARHGAVDRGAVPPEITELVAKPSSEGSSVGIEMLHNDDAGWESIARLAQNYDPLLIERRIRGREFTAAVIGHPHDCAALPLVEIRPRREYYDYTAKYTAGQTEYICPAPLEAGPTASIQAYAQTIFRELDLAPYARMDFILDAAEQPWFLEANTLPGFTPLSLVPQAAHAAGIEFQELLELLLLLALERWEARQEARHG
jgi:D-alanine-D-alanine ligase